MLDNTATATTRVTAPRYITETAHRFPGYTVRVGHGVRTRVFNNIIVYHRLRRRTVYRLRRRRVQFFTYSLHRTCGAREIHDERGASSVATLAVRRVRLRPFSVVVRRRGQTPVSPALSGRPFRGPFGERWQRWQLWWRAARKRLPRWLRRRCATRLWTMLRDRGGTGRNREPRTADQLRRRVRDDGRDRGQKAPEVGGERAREAAHEQPERSVRPTARSGAGRGRRTQAVQVRDTPDGPDVHRSPARSSRWPAAGGRPPWPGPVGGHRRPSVSRAVIRVPAPVSPVPSTRAPPAGIQITGPPRVDVTPWDFHAVYNKSSLVQCFARA